MHVPTQICHMLIIKKAIKINLKKTLFRKGRGKDQAWWHMHSVGRGWWSCEYKASLVYLVTSVNEFSMNEFSSESLSLRMMKEDIQHQSLALTCMHTQDGERERVVDARHQISLASEKTEW